MAVYTVIERDTMEAFLEPFAIGQLMDFQGASDGIENTTYFITSQRQAEAEEENAEQQQQFVLTLFESHPFDELQYFVDLTTALHQQMQPVPCPVVDYNGKALHQLHEKPALLYPRVPGQHLDNVAPEHCQQIGTALANLHQNRYPEGLHRDNDRGIDWIIDQGSRLAPYLEAEDTALMHSEIQHAENVLTTLNSLPRGIIHGDLFVDNALFNGDQLAGIIDFYNASNDILVLDLAITVNAWCSCSDGSLDMPRANAMVDAYQAVRPLSLEEKSSWQHLLRIAALRFWLSRLLTAFHLEDGELEDQLAPLKNPNDYKEILKASQQGQWHLGTAE